MLIYKHKIGEFFNSPTHIKKT